MKRLIIGSLFAAGCLFAQKVDKPLSWTDRLALQSQYPKIHIANANSRHPEFTHGDRMATSKTTVNLYVPVGK